MIENAQMHAKSCPMSWDWWGLSGMACGEIDRSLCYKLYLTISYPGHYV
jgi:hypothetical protein